MVQLNCNQGNPNSTKSKAKGLSYYISSWIKLNIWELTIEEHWYEEGQWQLWYLQQFAEQIWCHLIWSRHLSVLLPAQSDMARASKCSCWIYQEEKVWVIMDRPRDAGEGNCSVLMPFALLFWWVFSRNTEEKMPFTLPEITVMLRGLNASILLLKMMPMFIKIWKSELAC